MKKDIYKGIELPEPKLEVQKESKEIVIKLETPEIQKVEIENLPSSDEKIEFPEIQKVQVINPFEFPKIKFPEVQKSEVTNFPEPKEVKFPEVQKVEIINSEKVEFPKVQKVEVMNPVQSQLLPVGEGNIPGKADPVKYIPVRLTDGKRFYNALEDAFVAANQKSASFVDSNGKPTQVQLDSQGRLPTVAGGATVTTTSGSPLYNFITNWPTIQQVYTVNPGSATVTTTSGTPLDTFIRNFPTIQTVELNGNRYFQIQPGVTTAVSGSLSLTTTSGSPLNASIVNFPTVATVNVQNIPAITGNITTLSGSQVDIKNFPTVQTVNVQSMPNITIGNSPNVTTLSGSQVDVKNFPTVQTVNVQNMPAITGTVTANQGGNWTTASGSIVDIKNFPTVQTVNVQNLPNVTIGSMPNQTSVSGTNFHTFIDNIPTIQGVKVYDANSNLMGISVNPLTTSGTTFANVLIPKTVGITASSSGDNTIISAPTNGQRIYVYAWNISFSGTVNAKFTDGAAGTLLSGLYYGVANAGGGNAVSPNSQSMPPAPVLWVGSPNTALVLNLSAAVAVGGSVSYYVI